MNPKIDTFYTSKRSTPTTAWGGPEQLSQRTMLLSPSVLSPQSVQNTAVPSPLPPKRLDFASPSATEGWPQPSAQWHYGPRSAIPEQELRHSADSSPEDSCTAPIRPFDIMEKYSLSLGKRKSEGPSSA